MIVSDERDLGLNSITDPVRCCQEGLMMLDKGSPLYTLYNNLFQTSLYITDDPTDLREIMYMAFYVGIIWGFTPDEE